jgi:tRNA U55 pseudouridine synthase TruB
VEPFETAGMVGLEALRSLSASGSAWPLLPADRAVAHLPVLSLTLDQAQSLMQGRTVALQAQLTPQAQLAQAPLQSTLWRLYDADGRFLGLGASDAAAQLRSRRLFPAPLTLT